jgi:hypothetical protein
MRWIGVALAIGLAAFALANVRARRDAPSPVPIERIGDASKAELERVLRESGAGEGATP